MHLFFVQQNVPITIVEQTMEHQAIGLLPEQYIANTLTTQERDELSG